MEYPPNGVDVLLMVSAVRIRQKHASDTSWPNGLACRAGAVEIEGIELDRTAADRYVDFETTRSNQGHAGHEPAHTGRMT